MSDQPNREYDRPMTDKTPAKAATPAPTEKPVAPAAPATPETTTPVAPEVEADELAPEGTAADGNTAQGADDAGTADTSGDDDDSDDTDDADDEEGDDDDSDDDDLDPTQDRYRVIVVHDRAVPGYLPQGASHTFELYAKSEADAEKRVTKKGGLLAVSWPDNSSTEADREKKSHKGHDGQWEVASVAKIF